MSAPTIKPLFKNDVAELLGVSIRTVENLVRRGEIPPPASIGGRVLWHPDLFNSWLDERLRVNTTNTASVYELPADKPLSTPASTPPSNNGLRRNFQARQARLAKG